MGAGTDNSFQGQITHRSVWQRFVQCSTRRAGNRQQGDERDRRDRLVADRVFCLGSRTCSILSWCGRERVWASAFTESSLNP